MKAPLKNSVNNVTKISLFLSALALTVFAPSLFADHDDERNARYADDYNNRGQTKYVYADVVNVEPIVRYVTVSRPERVCEQVEYRADRRHRRHDSAGGTIAGGLLGGVIGRQFGGGKGRDAATIAGVLIGSAIGHDAEANNSGRDRHRNRDHEVRTRERCETRYERHEEERIDGYRVSYSFQGENFTTRTEYEPGDKIRIAVNARPAPERYRDRNDTSRYQGELNYDYDD